MNKIKEHRKKMADLTSDIQDIDQTVEQLNSLLAMAVADDVSSEVGQLMFIFNPHENIYIAGASPLVLAPNNLQLNELQEPQQIIGMHLQFTDPVLKNTTYSSSISMENSMLIRALSHLKNDLLNEQKNLDEKLDDLIKQKKAAP